eukprot:2740412-Heterocapsa_arctica.AAC.1
MEHTDSDHSDQGSDDEFPGHNVRKEAYRRLVENHKDQIFQHNEDKQARRHKTNRKLNQPEDKDATDKTAFICACGNPASNGL